MNEVSHKKIILFDGSCGLCNRSIKFVLNREKNNELLFSPLQSEFGKSLLRQFNIEGETDSMVLIENNQAFIKSSAALRVTKYLKNLWPAAQGFLIIPPFIRNFVYDFVARKRIAWFGNADYCEMMTPELRKRFIE